MLEGIEGVNDYVIQSRKVNGYQITRPVRTIGFRMESWNPGFHLQYEFRALGQSMGVVGCDYADAEQKLCDALVALYSDLTRIDDSHASEKQRIFNSIGRADLSTFIMPVCLPSHH
ncbi:MAG: hypothetical protein QT00_C0001G0432 [archaeon GW2011_AR5]|nr:MAG: hypothetical protein QT00_C0001G0432 [archaeon GW2011_AR5]MBS3051674.1 hypothetical protein [Candidatus Aenigmarchaeota archaeon]